MPRVVFRVDASGKMGAGHVMRCLTLAKVLRERDSDVSFISREHAGNLCKLIEDAGFTVRRLPLRDAEAQADDVPAHAAWLGAGWQEDAELTRASIDALSPVPDWLVVDHYALDRRWERLLRSCVRRIMVIDDLADRLHDCDLLLDQNVTAQMHTRYVGQVPASCGMLLGPEYALLQPDYAELHRRVVSRRGPVHRIFIFFGGADRQNLTGRSLAGFLLLDRLDVQVDVLIAAGSPHTASLRSQAMGRDNIHLHGNLPSLAPLMAKAGLAIGAGGATTWERLCLGLPSLVVTVAENQRAIAEELDRRGLIRYLGHQDRVGETEIADALKGLIKEDSLEAWSQRCLGLVDGNGAARVGAVLGTSSDSQLRARRAGPEDEALLLNWANDPVTRRNAFVPGQISVAAHHAWFHERLNDPENCRLYIIETPDGTPVGTVRFSRHDQGWEVHFSLAPVFRGRGIGRRMLETAMQNLRADNMGALLIFGQVKEDNLSSRRIFQALAFEARPESRAGIVVYQRVL